MVITPFFPFIMSIPLHIFGNNEIIVQIENVLVMIFTLYIIEKLINKKIYLIILFLVFPLSLMFPSYNLMLFELLVMILYCEKNIDNNDLILGILVGLMILTKQNVGLIIVIVLILSQIKNKKRIIKRLIGLIIPITILLLYLIINKALYNFVDQCFLGLFEFGGENKRIDLISLISIIYLAIIIHFIRKNPKKIENYYILAFFGIELPMADLYHTQIFNLAFLIAILLNIDIKKEKEKLINISSIILIISSQIIMFSNLEKPIIYPNNINHFEYRYIKKSNVDFANEIKDYINQNKEEKIIFLVYDAYFIKTFSDKKIDKLDLINYGNSGKNGTKKNIELIKKNKDAIFIINEDDLKIKGQIDIETIKYIKEKGKKIGNLRIYSIYKLE